MKNSYYYLGANPTVDLIVKNHLNEILLVKRKSTVEACPNMWALPGGFIDTLSKKGEYWKEGLESSESAALRELLEETNLKLDNVILNFVGIFEGNQRDPRDNDISWSKSHAFFYEIDKSVYEEQKGNLKGMDDVEDIAWVNINNLPQLAFDHSLIVNTALNKYLHKKLKI